MASALPVEYPDDKRAHPRVPCTIDCLCAGSLTGHILNISAGGALIFFPEGFDPSCTQTALSFQLPATNTPLEVSIAVLECRPLRPSGAEIRARFLDPDEETLAQLHRYVMGRIISDVSDLLESGETPPATDRIEVVADAEQVRSLFQAVCRPQQDIPGLLFLRGVGELFPFTFDRSAADHLQLLLTDPTFLHPKTGETVHLMFNNGHQRYHSFTSVRERSGRKVTADIPPRLFCYQLRRSPRRVPEEPMEVHIPLPYPPGKKIQREVVDISGTGLAFKVQPQDPYFLPGTPIFDMAICGSKEQEAVHKSAQVIHVSPVNHSNGTLNFIKIGVDFANLKAGFAKGHRAASPRDHQQRSFLSRISSLVRFFTPKKSTRKDRRVGSLGPGVQVVRYRNERREDIAAILNTTATDSSQRLVAPVVIISPAHSKRKESTSGLALTLIENFRRRNRDMVVLRYDGIRNLGESYKDPDCRVQDREAYRMTMSQAVEDVFSTLNFVYDNPYFAPTKVILVSPSLQGVSGRRAVFLDQGKRIHYWLGVFGAPSGQEVVRNACGGLDYIAQYATGHRAGGAKIMGVLVDTDHFCQDALDAGIFLMSDAKREVARVPIPITWISGEHDAWIDPSSVREFISAAGPGPREHIVLPTGHVPLNSTEALLVFSLVTRKIWQFLFSEDIEAVYPNLQEYVKVRRAEWARTPKHPLPDKRGYWQNYLLGDGDHRISYDVLSVTDEYIDFMRRQVALLDVRREQRVCDMGCGTGNFAVEFLKTVGKRRSNRPASIVLVDFVPEALNQATAKIQQLQQKLGFSLPGIHTVCHTLELNPLRTLRRFLEGQFFGYEPLVQVFKNLSEHTVEMWKSVDNWRLHDLLRGKSLTPEDTAFLKQCLPKDEVDTVLDINRVARFMRRAWSQTDLSWEGRKKVKAGAEPALWDLELNTLSFKNLDAPEHLPFESESVDRILCSLVLSYLDNPFETLKEFHRCLAPGGKIVLSSMQPDVDMSKIYRNLLHKLKTDQKFEVPGELNKQQFIEEVRHYVNSAAFLLTLVEEGQFSFFSRSEMRRLMERAGFHRVETFESFGSPPQAHIFVGYRA